MLYPLLSAHVRSDQQKPGLLWLLQRAQKSFYRLQLTLHWPKMRWDPGSACVRYLSNNFWCSFCFDFVQYTCQIGLWAISWMLFQVLQGWIFLSFFKQFIRLTIVICTDYDKPLLVESKCSTNWKGAKFMLILILSFQCTWLSRR